MVYNSGTVTEMVLKLTSAAWEAHKPSVDTWCYRDYLLVADSA